MDACRSHANFGCSIHSGGPSFGSAKMGHFGLIPHQNAIFESKKEEQCLGLSEAHTKKTVKARTVTYVQYTYF